MINYWCKIEGCLSIVENHDIGLCATHAREARKKSEAKQKAPRKRISKQSEEGKARLDMYYPIRDLYMRQNPCCQAHGICFPDEPSTLATEIHHRKSRDGDLLYDVRFFLSVCRRCHERITIESEWAYNEGLSLSRHQTI